ncbi:unnamed protein product [Closterium sp. NIES-54]
MYAVSTSDEGDCYLCLPPDPGGEAAALCACEAAALGASVSAAPGAGESALSGTASAQVFHTFTLDSGASRSFFRDRTTLTPLSRPVAVSLADPSGGPYAAHQLNLQPRVSLPETSPTLRWTRKVGDASAFRVCGSRAFVRNLSAGKLSPHAIPCVFLGFPPDAPGWQFYRPTSRRVLSSQDVTLDESVPYYCLFPYRTAPLPPPPLFLAPGPPPVDLLPPQGPAPSGVSKVDAVEPAEVAVDSGAARATVAAGPGGTRTGGSGAARTGGAAGAAGVGPAGGAAGAAGGTGAAVPAGAGVAGVTGAGAAGGVGAGGSASAGASEGAGVDAVGARGATGTGAAAGGTGAVPASSGGATRPRPYFVPLLEQLRSQLQLASPLPVPSPYTGPTRGLAERREPGSHPASPVRAARTSRRAPRPRPPAVPGMHQVALRPSTAPLRVSLPSPPEPSLPVPLDPESDSLRAASPTVTRLLATVVTDPSFESTAASALVAELVDFSARCRLDYATSLVAASESVCPPSVGGECALSTDVLEDRQEEFQCFGAALPHLVSKLLAPD